MPKVAYITVYDPNDVRQWSGLGKFIRDSLAASGFEVDCIGPMSVKSYSRRAWLKVKRHFYNDVLKRRRGVFSSERDHHIARQYASSFASRLKNRSYDLIFSPGSIPVAY